MHSIMNASPTPKETCSGRKADGFHVRFSNGTPKTTRSANEWNFE